MAAMRSGVALAALLMAGAPALAADEIVVTGRPLPAALGDRAYDIVVIDRERVASTASNRIEDALRDVAGLQQFRRSDARSANATSQGATLRGLGGNASSRALLVLDGVPQSDPFGGWVTWPAYSPDRIGRVVVARGGGSGVYGSGALSGTIELESITEAQPLRGSLAVGSRDALEFGALATARPGGGFAFASASYARGDGFIPIVADQRGPADIPAPFEQASLALRGIIPAGDATEIQASMLGFRDRRTRGTILSGNGGQGADASIRLVHRGDWQVQALAYLQLREFQSRFVAIDATRSVVTQTVDQFSVPSTGLGARFEVRPPLGEGAELRLGGDWRRTTGETNELFTYVAGLPTRVREAGGQSETFGAFAEGSARLGQLTITGGARIDRWFIRDGRLIERTLSTGASLRNDRPPDRNGWEPTGRLGLAYEAGTLTLRGAAYLGWRLPTLNELYRPFRVGPDATAANPALSPETMRGVEAGMDWAIREGVTVRATLFDNRLRDAIANVTIGAGPGNFPGVGFVAAGGAYRQRLNISAIRSRGFELDLAARLGELTFTGSYAHADARVRAGGIAAPLDGLRPAQVPRHLASATLGWRWLSATLRHVSAQFEDDANIRRLDGATTLDAVARIPLAKRLALSLRGENLANARVETAVSGAGVIERASPRSIWVGLVYGD